MSWLFGIFLTPVIYYVIQSLAGDKPKVQSPTEQTSNEPTGSGGITKIKEEPRSVK